MQEFHILKETPANSGTYLETGETIDTNVTDAAARCIELSQDGTRYGMWVYESVNVRNLAKPAPGEPQEPEPPAVEKPVNDDVPVVSQTGTTLNCTQGNWTGEPTSYAYQWKLDGTNAGTDAGSYEVQEGDVGKSATCVVTATNEAGSTAAPPSNALTVA